MSNPIAFFEELYDSAKDKLRKYLPVYRADLSLNKPADLTIVRRKQDDRFTHTKHVDALSGERELVFSYFFYPSEAGVDGSPPTHLFISRGKVSLEMFISLYNLVLKLVSDKITSGDYQLDGDVEAGRFIIGFGKKYHEGPMGGLPDPLTVDELSRSFKGASSEITFVRLNLPWFEMSYEGDICAFSSAEALVDEIALFLQETVTVPNRVLPIHRYVAEILEP